MNIQEFEVIVAEYKKIRFNDEEWEKADSLLEQIANTHTQNPALFEPTLKQHKISY